MITKQRFLSNIAGKYTPGRLKFEKFSGGACPQTPLEVPAFTSQFYRVPAYSQASALLLQKLMKTLNISKLLLQRHNRPETKASFLFNILGAIADNLRALIEFTPL